MKKEKWFILIVFVAALIFCLLLDQISSVFEYTDTMKQYVLCLLLLLVQTQILNVLQNILTDADPTLRSSKRKLYLFYTEHKDQFPALYETVMKKHKTKAVGTLLTLLGYTNLDEKTQATGMGWLDGSEPIPYGTLPKTFSMMDRLRMKRRIHDFHITCEERDDLFFSCLTNTILDRNSNTSIVESILIWISYFYFLIEIFGINLNDHRALIYGFIMLTVFDICRHYLIYRSILKSKVEAIDDFYAQIDYIHALQQNEAKGL